MMTAQLILLLAASAGIAVERPLQLVVEPTDSGVNVKIVGNSDVECIVEYELLVQGGKSPNNRSLQRGKARLLPRREILVAKSSLGLTPPATWSARLLARTCEGKSYEMSSSSGKR